MPDYARGQEDFLGVKQGDTLNISWDVEGIDLTGCTLKMQVKSFDGVLVLTFSTVLGGGMYLTIDGDTQTIQILKSAAEMNLEPNRYKYDIEARLGSRVDTFMEGFFEVVPQITT